MAANLSEKVGAMSDLRPASGCILKCVNFEMKL